MFTFGQALEIKAKTSYMFKDFIAAVGFYKQVIFGSSSSGGRSGGIWP